MLIKLHSYRLCGCKGGDKTVMSLYLIIREAYWPENIQWPFITVVDAM